MCAALDKSKTHYIPQALLQMGVGHGAEFWPIKLKQKLIHWLKLTRGAHFPSAMGRAWMATMAGAPAATLWKRGLKHMTKTSGESKKPGSLTSPESCLPTSRSLITWKKNNFFSLLSPIIWKLNCWHSFPTSFYTGPFLYEASYL